MNPENPNSSYPGETSNLGGQPPEGYTDTSLLTDASAPSPSQYSESLQANLQQPGQQPPSINPQQQGSTQSSTNMPTLILQWLTYAFWGWTVLALSTLTSNVVASLISDSDVGGFTPYAIAATLVLLPIAFACDKFYSKKEPLTKRGPELAVAAIHAVIFAIFGVGSLIVAVISIVTMLTSSSDHKDAIVVLVSALIITLFYTATFLRTIHPKRLAWLAKFYPILMLVTIGIITVLGVIGPMAKERATKDDRLIESELSTISESINRYARKNGNLPDSLDNLELRNNDAKKLVSSRLVAYKPEGVYNRYYDSDKNSSASFRRSQQSSDPEIYKYQLCVNYKKEKRSSYSYEPLENEEYTSASMSTYEHPAGEVCYKRITDRY